MGVKVNRDAILAARKLATKEVSVPEWGDENSTVTIKELTAGEAQVLGMKAKENESEAMILWVVAGVINEDGSRMFSDADKEALSGLSAAAILRVGSALIKLCGFGTEETKEQEKN